MKSQSILFSWIKREQRTLTQWRQTTIKSIYEGGNKADTSEKPKRHNFGKHYIEGI